MKLKLYIEKLQKLLEEQGDIDLIYSTDDEGNSYDYVHYDPSLVYFNAADKEIIADEDIDEWDESDYVEVICVN